MRMTFAVLLACALGAPAALALPLPQSGLSASAPVVQAKAKAVGSSKHAKKGAKAKGGKCAPGAICPLVGGGDY
jgi:hypothetical protein